MWNACSLLPASSSLRHSSIRPALVSCQSKTTAGAAGPAAMGIGSTSESIGGGLFWTARSSITSGWCGPKTELVHTVMASMKGNRDGEHMARSITDSDVRVL
eukprot:5134448-Amphidinium_carterae.4